MIVTLIVFATVVTIAFVLQWFQNELDSRRWAKERADLIARIQTPDVVRAKAVAESLAQPTTRIPTADELDWTRFLPTEEDLALIGEEQQ